MIRFNQPHFYGSMSTTATPDVSMIVTPPELPGAICAQSDPEVWFPEGAPLERDPERFRALCDGCPVITECLAYALERESGVSATHRFGIWGGTTPTDRAQLDHSQRRPLAEDKRHPSGDHKPCEWCGMDFYRRASHMPCQWSGQRYCCLSCAAHANAKRRREAKEKT